MWDEPSGNPVYPIRVVREMTGLSERQIRYYEEIGFISPSRSRGNQRLYSELEVEMLRKLRALVDQGVELRTACRMVRAAMEEPPGSPGKTMDRFVDIGTEDDSDAASHFRARLIATSTANGTGAPPSLYTWSNILRSAEEAKPVRRPPVPRKEESR